MKSYTTGCAQAFFSLGQKNFTHFCGLKEIAVHIKGKTFWAGVHRCLFEPVESRLLIADCHFGKITHFRNHAVPISHQAAIRDYELLIQILNDKSPKTCIFMGDLFHSKANSEWIWLQQLLATFPDIEFILVQGNHDILPPFDYKASRISCVTEMVWDQLLLTHEPVDSENAFNICGHIHPGLYMAGKGKQRLGLPCYFKTDRRLYLPSFGRLTGFVNMAKLEENGRAFAFTDHEIYTVDL